MNCSKQNNFNGLLFVSILVLGIILLFVVKTCDSSFINPDDHNIPKDGVTDCVSVWEELDANMPDGSTIVLPAGAVYYINSSGGLTFTKTVHIIGSRAQFKCGASVGNNPTLKFTGANTILENFVVDSSLNHTDGNDDDFSDTVDSMNNYNFRSSISLCGDNSVCRNISTINSVAGVRLNCADFCIVEGCDLKNTQIKSPTAGPHNHNAGVFLRYADYCKIRNNNISGHGQNILVSCSFYGDIYSNTCLNASNNGIYLSSDGDFNVHNNIIRLFDSTGIKARDSGNNIHHNRVICDIENGNTSGITITGNGDDDGGGFNGIDTSVNSNIITGDMSRGILVGVQDGYHFKNVCLFQNLIRIIDDPVQAGYGIHFSSTASDGAMVVSNAVYGDHSFGLLMSAASGYDHRNMMINLNNFIGGSNDAFSLSGVSRSMISLNSGKNCGTGRTGLLVDDGSLNFSLGNNFGDTKDTGTQKYGIEERGTSTLNWYVNNWVDGVTHSEYYLIDANSLILDPRY